MSEYAIYVGVLVSAVLAWPALHFIYRFPMEVQKKAFTKAFFLWFFATTPVFAALIMSKMQAGVPMVEQVAAPVIETFSFTEAFVYTATFVSPMLYMMFDFIYKLKDLKSMREVHQLLHNMRGLPWIILSSLVLLGITLLAFGSAKSDSSGFPDTLVAQAMSDRGWLIYLVSLLIWYCVILWEADPNFSFERHMKKKETDFAERYAKSKGQSE